MAYVVLRREDNHEHASRKAIVAADESKRLRLFELRRYHTTLAIGRYIGRVVEGLASGSITISEGMKPTRSIFHGTR